MRRSAVVALALLAAIVLAPAAALAVTAGQTAYLKAVRSFDDEEWDAAIKGFRTAIAEDPVEGLRKVRSTGLNFDDYLPHYYLGVALFQAGRPAEARVELAESQKQGAVTQRAALARTLRDTLAKIPASQIADARPDAKPTAHVALPPPTAAPAAATPHVVLAATAPVPTPAPKGPKPVPTLLVSIPTEPPPTAAIAAGTAVPQATPAASTLSEAERRAAHAGIRLYFGGRFEEAAHALEPLAPRAASLRLVYSFSLASQWILGGRKDAALLERAKREGAAARAAGARLDDEGFVSPDVRAILAGG